MKVTAIQEEIRDLNLAYLMLAQQMLREDREAAMFRLGIGADVAELIDDMSPAQLLKMAGGQMLLCRFRFDDSNMLGVMAGKGRQGAAAGIHAAIIAASKPVEVLA
ncbi:MAG: flagellar transcriptional regulator FlhD [Zoogloeaceae bacterium]|nr:flagellar transcriptional regulator FlhD [Rhodocyclaceae bacterium]MCP5234394.1 flagellar transcriptional regulator FlhD [Zoogloeaceae bacterium]